VGSDDYTPATRRAPPKVTPFAPWRTRQTVGKVPASRAAATFIATQTAEAKKKKWKRTGPAVSTDTATVSSGVETIDVGDDEDDAKSPSARRSHPRRCLVGLR
jgi:hypothetical protein